MNRISNLRLLLASICLCSAALLLMGLRCYHSPPTEESGSFKTHRGSTRIDRGLKIYSRETVHREGQIGSMLITNADLNTIGRSLAVGAPKDGFSIQPIFRAPHSKSDHPVPVTIEYVIEQIPEKILGFTVDLNYPFSWGATTLRLDVRPPGTTVELIWSDDEVYGNGDTGDRNRELLGLLLRLQHLFGGTAAYIGPVDATDRHRNIEAPWLRV